VWQSADKVVVSTTMGEPVTARTRVERGLEIEMVRALKDASPDDLLVGGPTLAAAAFRAGLVDECHLWVWPVILGGRLPALPADLRVDLTLVQVERLGGAVRLRYDVR
jgi:riboflavin biosynthesis pyrimidine reductase